MPTEPSPARVTADADVLAADLLVGGPARVALDVNADDRVTQVYVDGHTDSIGTPLRNRELSEARAKAVAAYLQEQGVAQEKLVTRFHSDRYPVAEVATPGPRHRRATVRLEREKDESDAEPVVTQAKRDDIVVVD